MNRSQHGARQLSGSPIIILSSILPPSTHIRRANYCRRYLLGWLPARHPQDRPLTPHIKTILPPQWICGLREEKMEQLPPPPRRRLYGGDFPWRRTSCTSN